jgi:hypothetical protein
MRPRVSLHTGLVTIALGLTSVSALRGQSPTVLPQNTIAVTSFSPDTLYLNSFNVTVQLRHTVAGLTATHYRVSHFSDFRDAQWQTYVPSPTVTTNSTWFTPDAGQTNRSTGTVFFQVRARNPNAGRPVALSGSGLPSKPGGTAEPSGTVTVQPDFINSNTVSKRLHVVFAG